MEGFFAIAGVFVAVTWLMLHYITKWKTAPTMTTDDESLLEELYNLAKRLDERMDTVERLVASDHPDFQSPRIAVDLDTDNQKLRELDRMFAEKGGRK